MSINKIFKYFLNNSNNFKQCKRLASSIPNDAKNQDLVRVDADKNSPAIFKHDSRIQPVIDWEREMEVIKNLENESPLEPAKNQLEMAPRPSVPTFNFAAYVNDSESLKKLVDLGVDLSKIEKRKGLPQFLLKLDFERDMKDHILFLKDVGLPAEAFGHFITKNPLIFKESIEDLHTRIYYLESKKFLMPQITQIVTRNPFWLMFSTKRIDRRLGFFQKNFELLGNEIRLLSVKEPRLITYSMEHLRMSTFSVREEMGFNKDEIKELLLGKPKLWMISHPVLINRFDYVNRTMGIPHEQLVKVPEILLCREFKLKERHGFLNFLGRAQYDPTKPLYISPKTLVTVEDRDFVVNICDSNMESYQDYLKTL